MIPCPNLPSHIVCLHVDSLDCHLRRGVRSWPPAESRIVWEMDKFRCKLCISGQILLFFAPLLKQSGPLRSSIAVSFETNMKEARWHDVSGRGSMMLTAKTAQPRIPLSHNSAVGSVPTRQLSVDLLNVCCPCISRPCCPKTAYSPSITKPLPADDRLGVFPPQRERVLPQSFFR